MLRKDLLNVRNNIQVTNNATCRTRLTVACLLYIRCSYIHHAYGFKLVWSEYMGMHGPHQRPDATGLFRSCSGPIASYPMTTSTSPGSRYGLLIIAT